MTHEHSIGESEELAALYATGALTQEERLEYEKHLQTGCGPCSREMELLAPVMELLIGQIAPVVPDSSARAKLMDTIGNQLRDADPAQTQTWREWTEEPVGADLFVKRAGDGAWEGTGVEGVLVRRLFVDRHRDQFTALVRMAPGASYPRHVHAAAEECLVLEGDLHVGGEVLRKGDYQRAPAGSRHGIQSTEKGCLLLITSSLSDDLEPHHD